ncbi:MAG: AraC family transcriptional regulator [Ruminococcaceae bacterium]|nr:AraC family transcriptional regulator [Oscillospiraceae bacterium]
MNECHLSTLNQDGKFKWWDINHNSRESQRLPLITNIAACVKPDIHSTCFNKNGRLDYFLLHMISGSLYVKTAHGVADICENDMIIIPPRTPYYLESTKEPFCYLCVHFTGSQALEKIEEYGLRLFPEINSLNLENHIQLRFKTLFEAIAKNDELREKELGILLERLFIEASRGVRNNEIDRIPLSRSIRHINEFYSTDIKITDLAKMESMCMTTFNLKFKAQMGMPPTKYIIKLRMEYALSLLETSNMSIAQIGDACGYSDVNFFSRTFKSFFGVSPTRYRAQFRI